MNIELKPIAESKVRQLGGDVCGVLVRTDSGVMAVSEHGRCTRLDAGVMGPVEPEARESLFSERDLFLMKEAMNAGQYYESLEDWLDEVISDGGHTVEQHLAYDAGQKQVAHAQERPEFSVDRVFLVQLLDDRNKRIDALEKQVAEAARAQGGQGAELDEYQKFDQKLCQEVFEKLNAEFDKDPKGGITVYTEDWRASVHHLKRLPRQNIGTIGYVNTQPQPAVPEGLPEAIKAIADRLEVVEGKSADGGYMWDARDCAEFIREEADKLSTPTTPQADGRIDHQCELCGHKCSSNDLMDDCVACTKPAGQEGA